MINKKEIIKKFVSGKIETLFSSKLTIEDIFLNIINNNERRIAIKYFNKEKEIQKLTYKQLKDNTYLIANYIKHNTNFSNATIVLKANNSSRWIEVFWGILASGNKPILINAKSTKNEVEKIISLVKAKCVISDDKETYSINKIEIQNIKDTKIDSNFVWENEVSFVTSGTTGEPKIIKFTGYNFAHSIRSLLNIEERTYDLVYPKSIGNINGLLVLPLHHIYGFFGSYIWLTFFGSTIYIPSSLDITNIFNICQKNNITHIYSVPLFWEIIDNEIQKIKNTFNYKQALTFASLESNMLNDEKQNLKERKMLKHIQQSLLGTSIKYCVSGGSYISKKTLRNINCIGYPLRTGFGMTEVGVSSFETSNNIIDRITGSIGLPLNGVTYKIDSDIDEGELLIKSNVITDVPLKNDFIRTGDIAKFKDGKYFIKGRIKDVIINSNGENIYPDAIELIYKKIPHITKYSILGVNLKNNNKEELVLVVEQSNKISNEDLINQINNCSKRLPNGISLAKAFILKGKLPLSGSGKTKRTALKEMILNNDNLLIPLDLYKKNKNREFSENVLNTIIKPLKSLFASSLNIDENNINLESHYIYDLGGNSMGYISLVKNIEDYFKISVDQNKYNELLTIESYTDFIMNLKI